MKDDVKKKLYFPKVNSKHNTNVSLNSDIY